MAILNRENGEDIHLKINQLIANNINHLDTVLPEDQRSELLVCLDLVKQLFVKPLVKNPRSVSFPYYQRLNINIYFQILWKPISVRSRWRKCH